MKNKNYEYEENGYEVEFIINFKEINNNSYLKSFRYTNNIKNIKEHKLLAEKLNEFLKFREKKLND